MKTLNKIWILCVLAGVMLISACYGSYYVTARPAEPYYIRPASPYYGAVWIQGEWEWNAGRYVYIAGHWDKPRVNHVYIAGHWDQSQRGYVWIKGYWK